jgi:hypothetical protein
VRLQLDRQLLPLRMQVSVLTRVRCACNLLLQHCTADYGKLSYKQQAWRQKISYKQAASVGSKGKIEDREEGRSITPPVLVLVLLTLTLLLQLQLHGARLSQPLVHCSRKQSVKAREAGGMTVLQDTHPPHIPRRRCE